MIYSYFKFIVVIAYLTVCLTCNFIIFFNNKMSKTYKIHRWDAVLFGNSTDPTPIIYIKANSDLLEFAKANKDALLVDLKIPDSIYNDKLVAGLWFKSSDIPNCRPEFFEKTELYVIVLQAPWHGYPDNLGEIAISGLYGGRPVKNSEHKNLVLKEPLNSFTEADIDRGCRRYGGCGGFGGLPVSAIIGIIAAFLVLIFIVVFINKNKN